MRAHSGIVVDDRCPSRALDHEEYLFRERHNSRRSFYSKSTHAGKKEKKRDWVKERKRVWA